MGQNNFAWLNVPAEVAAKRLLGCELISDIDNRLVRVRIVETEAYDQADEASHAYSGRTKRNDAMFKNAGHLYVYFTYGMHYCCNVVCGEDGVGAGVLIRAVEPLEGMETIEERRGMGGVNATNGPAKACKALGITGKWSGHNLYRPPIRLIKHRPFPESVITTGPRIGISKAVHELRRFYIAGNPYVSRK